MSESDTEWRIATLAEINDLARDAFKASLDSEVIRPMRKRYRARREVKFERKIILPCCLSKEGLYDDKRLEDVEIDKDPPPNERFYECWLNGTFRHWRCGTTLTQIQL